MTYASPTTINATKGFGEFLAYVNNVTDSWVSRLMMMAVYILIIIGYYKAREDFAGALAVAGFGTFVVGLLFWLGGFVDGWTLTISIALLLVGVVIILIDNKQN